MKQCPRCQHIHFVFSARKALKCITCLVYPIYGWTIRYSQSLAVGESQYPHPVIWEAQQAERHPQ